VEFRILGPLDIAISAGRLELGGTRQQIVLATLLLWANQIVTMDRLLEAIYGEDLPPTSRSQAQIAISALRRGLAKRGSTAVITTRPYGYVIEVGSEQLDSAQFEEFAAEGRAKREAAHPVQAVASYRDALRLWRGPALIGLELGRHHELAGELTSLVEEYPLRERLRSQLMLALYRCDRAAEALEVYRQARQIMLSEIGIEPSDRLQQLERAILVSHPALGPPAESIRIQQAIKQCPSLLPTDIADFVGRTDQISRIRSATGCAEASRVAKPAVPVVVIVGKGGIGKTSLAVHVSHQLLNYFPDAQLFADMHGATTRPVSPVQALERFLRALGVPGALIPGGLDERAEMYRSLLGDRRALVVIDDAASESQVTPLLPGRGAAAVIVTSRNRLAGLAGAIHIEVDVFDAGTSLELLAHVAGAARVRCQPDEAATVAEQCGHLPLALRIAGARLSARPHWSISQLAGRLTDETHRLDELRYGDLGVRPSISLSYESASGDAKRLFRRLAILDQPVFSGWLSAALLDMPLARAVDLLDDLVNAQLVETTGPGTGVHSQYRFHHLIRIFARERLAAEEPPVERADALKRALGALFDLVEQAHHRYWGRERCSFHTDALRWPLPKELVDELLIDPVSWYDSERTALVCAVRQAARAGHVELCWSLAYNSTTLFELRSYLDDWRTTHDIALEATQRADSMHGQAAMLYSIGCLDVAQQFLDQARERFTASARLFHWAGDDQGVAVATCKIAFIDRLRGNHADATSRYQQAIAIFRKTPDLIAAAHALHGLAMVKLELSQLSDAKRLLADALRMSRSVRPGKLEAQVLHRTGEAYLQSGELDKAIDTFELALARARSLGDPIGESCALRGIGITRTRQGEFGQAGRALQRAVDLARTSCKRLAKGNALVGLCELALARRDPEGAITAGREACEEFQRMGAPLYEARVLALLSKAHAARGDGDVASALSARATALHAKLAITQISDDSLLPTRGLLSAS
jgi:DNA-binding SARP family transcriptional activator